MKVECITRRGQHNGLCQGAAFAPLIYISKCRPAKTLLTFTTQLRVFRALRITQVSRKLTGLRFSYLARHIPLPSPASVGRRNRVKENNSKSKLIAKGTKRAGFHSRLIFRREKQRVSKGARERKTAVFL